MIYLTEEFVPSHLFYQEETAATFRLLEGARRLRRSGELEAAERRARDAETLSRETKAHVELAAALVHLADIYREMGRLGPARRCADEACVVLKRQAGRTQRYNEAVARYGLGLIHHLLGGDTSALNCYQEARALFEVAREHWAARDRTGQMVERCRRVEEWLGNLSECLTETEERGGLYTTLILPAWLLGDGGTPFSVAELEVTGAPLLVSRLRIGDRSFRVQGLLDGDVVALSKGRYRVLRVPPGQHGQVGAGEEDLVLLRRPDGELRVPCHYVRQDASGIEFGRFERDPVDPARIRFVRAEPHIIGGRDVAAPLPFLYFVALLKPEG